MLCGAAVAQGQPFPNKPIRFIVPFAPGGGADLVARMIRQKMSEFLGQPVLVDNRPGALGNTGTAFAAKAAPDGYTLVLGETGTLCINPHIREGKLRALAVTTRSRIDILPNVQTVAEAGLPDYDIAGWYGVMAPANTPREIVRQLNAALVRVAKLPEVRDPLTREGALVVGSSPEEFAALIRNETAKWGKAVQRTGGRS